MSLSVIVLAAFILHFSCSDSEKAGNNIPPQKKDGLHDTLKTTFPSSSFKAYEFNKQGELYFLSYKGDTLKRVDIEIANDDEQRKKGMMHRDTMPDDQAMLFIFEKEELLGFWMRNTILSLDMVFVNSNLEIVTIRENTNPISDRNYFPDEPAIYVVEVAAGFARRYNIKEGDKIEWSRD